MKRIAILDILGGTCFAIGAYLVARMSGAKPITAILVGVAVGVIVVLWVRSAKRG